MKKDSPYVYFGYLAEFGFIMIISTMCGLGVGLFLDKKLHTKFFTIIFLLFGVVGGFIGIYKTIMRIEKK